MKQLTCSHIGTRPQSEFTFGGDVRPMPRPSECSDTEWGSYVFDREGGPGVKREWWYHNPTGMWFVLERDTLSDEILAEVDLAEVRYEL